MKNASLRRRFRTGFRPTFELLETRLTPTTYNVSSLADSGDGSLRAAITSVNADNTADEIDFSVAGVIQLTSGALPAITNAVKIDGRTAPGFTSVPLVEIDNNGFAGLTLGASNSSLISMSIVNAGGDGVTLAGNTITVAGNYIGLALDGSAAANHANGIVVSSNGDIIGGTAEGAGNVISGNTANGILVENPTTSGTIIQGNFIGTNAAGSAAIGNTLSGVLLQTSGAATIGGSTAGAGNLISGNKNDGIEISGLLTTPELGAPASAGTGSLPAGTYFYVVTATTAQGETTASNEQTFTLATPGAVNINWTAVAGAASYKVYRGTAAGQENVLAATVFSPATTFKDSGAATTPGTPPLTNMAVLTGLAPSIIEGNKIGTNVTGTIALGNVFDGIHIEQASGTTIGGTSAGARNVISGNGGLPDSGIGIDLIGASTASTVIQGNFIGVDVSGGLRLGNNSNGIYLQGAVNTLIGGTSTGAGNVISSNAFIDVGEAGISLINSASNNTIEGNLIGTDVTGLVDLGNGGAGIRLDTGSSNNTVGGTTAAQRNVISGNGFGAFGPDAGITLGGTADLNVPQFAFSNIVEGNFIGVDATGGKALGNCLAGVAIFAGTGGNTIGGTAAGAGNVISGNSGEVGSGIFGDGVLITNSLSNSVLSNRIGVDVTGLIAVPNAGDGVDLSISANDNAIGDPNAGNIISGNGRSGIFVQDFSSNNNIIRGNAIGVDATRTVAIPNQRYGVEIASAENTQIGGMVADAGNVISGNVLGGISITGLVSPPQFGTPVLGLGGALPAGTYFYVITATNSAGETTASAERTITLAAPGAVVLSWVASGSENSGVSGYKIYRGTSAGGENVLVADVTGVASTTFTDAGAAIRPGSPPQTNTAFSPTGGTGNTVQGNTIGLNGAGTAAIPNPVGVLIGQASSNSVGLSLAGTGNVISGNLTDGVRISGSKAIGNSVVNNFIGTARDGITSFPNRGNGVNFESGADNVFSTFNPIIGVSTNVIQNNLQDGVLVQAASTMVPIISNSIFNNGKLGIELQPGANQDQPAPVLISALVTQGGTQVQGTATGLANSIITVELFASPSAPSTGPGQGKTFLRQFDIVIDASGNGFFSATVPQANLAGQFITATATVKGSIGRSSVFVNTSEFSTGVVVANSPVASLTIATYQDVLGRPPSVNDINFWVGELNGGVSRSFLAQAVWESPEHRAIEVHQYYEQYFQRAPDTGAQTFWVSQLQAGLGETTLQLALLVSAEFAQRHITADNDYVVAVYQYVLNRNPAPAEAQIWRAAEAAGLGQVQLAQAFLTSPEANGDLLTTYYSEFLNRKPDPAGEAYFLNVLAAGVATPQSVAETLLASDEFFALATGS